ncbi:MAG: hypothetical protein HY585_03835 [Candidatus Omnitrophica bacterium]|nr:hypothetical protein [Candidatus Omnitrophota bacterium]
MLIGKKPKYSVESEWAVILDRPVNEFGRGRSAEKLADTFSISLDEARELTENTPIILLDRLPLEVAEKVKNHFAQANIDSSLTNDTFTKRKCFRAVWPEQPNLSQFLNDTSPSFSRHVSEPSVPDVQASVPAEAEPADFVSHETVNERSADDEQRQLKELTLDLQKENELLRHQLDKAEDSVKERESKRFNMELENLRNERLRIEENQTRLRNENVALSARVQELEQSLKALKQVGEGDEGLMAKAQVTELRVQLDHFRAEYMRAQNTLRVAQSEAKQFQMEWTQTQKVLSEARAEIEDLKRMLSQAQANSVQLKEETERVRFEVENRLSGNSAELEEWKRKANDWSANYFKVVKENEFLRGRQSEELESLRVRNQQLNAQLDQAQRQIKGFMAQSEQQELIQKRAKAAQELVEKEAQLKILVQKQQTLESEIYLREEEMRKVLAEQEMVESEIVKAKQAQKYLLEQAKLREKSRFVRSKFAGQPDPSAQDPGGVEPTAE